MRPAGTCSVVTLPGEAGAVPTSSVDPVPTAATAATAAPLYVAGAARVRGRPRRFVDALIASGRARECADVLPPFAVTPLRETARERAVGRVSAMEREVLDFILAPSERSFLTPQA